MNNIKSQLSKRKKSRSAMVWHQFRKSRTAILGLCILSVFVLFAIFADMIADFDTKAIATNQQARFVSPSLENLFTDEAHIFGTDEYGRDVFARIIHGAPDFSIDRYHCNFLLSGGWRSSGRIGCILRKKVGFYHHADYGYYF